MALLVNRVEVVASGFDCEDCDGDRVIGVKTCHHSGNCPCGVADVDCEGCEGAGKHACGNCGDAPAIVRIGYEPSTFPDGRPWLPQPDLFCTSCAEQDEDVQRFRGAEKVQNA